VGLNLARSNAVALLARKEDELELVVKAPGKALGQTVVLSISYQSWECDCDGRVDPCEHVVASVLAAQKASSTEAPLQTAAQRWSRLLYRFFRQGPLLRVERSLAHADGTSTPLEESLSSLLARPAKGSSLHVEPHDLAVDRLFERTTRLPLSPERIEGILRLLSPSRNVLLDGKPVIVSDDVVLPRVVVEEEGENVRVTLQADPRVTEVLSPGIALCGETVCRLGETELTGPMLEKLPHRKTWGPSQTAELISQVLPQLAQRLKVEVKTRRLPPLDRELKPRVHLELNQLDTGLSVLPTLVYGAPPNVRIDNGKMVFLKGKVPVRDVAQETRLLHQLRSELNLAPGHRTQVTGPETARFLETLRNFKGDLGGDAARLLGNKKALLPQFRLALRQTEDGVPRLEGDVGFVLEGTGQKVDAEAVVKAFREGLSLVPLLEGGFAPLPLSWLAQHGEKLANLLAARKADGTFANHALLDAQDLPNESPLPFEWKKLAPAVDGLLALGEAPTLPEDVDATLRPYQLQGVRWLQWLKGAGLGGVLADDMGLGKTLQTLCALEAGTLVVCPTSVLPNWLAETRRFRPSLKVCAYHGPNRTLDASADIVLTTYALLRLDLDLFTQKRWKTVVLDEAQAIKNPDSQVSRAAYALSADFRLALTGTPLENRLQDLWSLFHFVNPGLLFNRPDFEERIATPIAEGQRGVAETLRKRIQPFVLRRLKKDVAVDLPPRLESVLPVALNDTERSMYDAIFAATRADVVKLLDAGGSVLQALEALLRLRQAACHLSLLPGQAAASSSKVEALLEALESAVANGHRALVFSQWTSFLDLLGPALEKAGLPFVRLDGQTPNRGEVVARFQHEEGPPVMLLSLKAGGVGLNLTSADHVFLMDPWWNPAVEAQATDRAHRIGQTRAVNVYRMISLGTVEEKILTLQDKKRALFEAAFGEGEGASQLSRQDLLELLA
jgi:superfamily II DNA or RNA helicase